MKYENDNIDKFVYLDKSYKMICQFNHKFKKWNPTVALLPGLIRLNNPKMGIKNCCALFAP